MIVGEMIVGEIIVDEMIASRSEVMGIVSTQMCLRKAGWSFAFLY